MTSEERKSPEGPQPGQLWLVDVTEEMNQSRHDAASTALHDHLGLPKDTPYRIIVDRYEFVRSSNARDPLNEHAAISFAYQVPSGLLKCTCEDYVTNDMRTAKYMCTHILHCLFKAGMVNANSRFVGDV